MQRWRWDKTNNPVLMYGENDFDRQTVGWGGVGGDKDTLPVPAQAQGANRGANPGSRGPGRLWNATESPYAVTGPTLWLLLPRSCVRPAVLPP
jgi:hypothetical protein